MTPQDFSSLETRLTFLEQASARSRATEGDAVDFHNLGFKSKIDPRYGLISMHQKITLDL